MKKKNKTVNANKDQENQCYFFGVSRLYIAVLQPKNTKDKTKYDLKVWQRCWESKNETRKLEHIPEDESITPDEGSLLLNTPNANVVAPNSLLNL
jgi:hypothetical protein